MERLKYRCLLAIGVAGFIGSFLLPYAGSWLRYVELPILFETATIALPDGGRLTATKPTQRVQRYAPDDRFQNGWFVDAKGGSFALGLTEDGLVAICLDRTRRLQLFDLEGRQISDAGRCADELAEFPMLLKPGHLGNEGVKLQEPVLIRPPKDTWFALLLVPFWHLNVAFLIGLIGALGLWLTRLPRRP